mmetsp:Transcript_27692/g.52439  ORF Transcript_27692/g.52439 Transcript_27692/m.52439 type:complete len:201 (+) Transcript_27692:432-1034(+)
MAEQLDRPQVCVAMVGQAGDGAAGHRLGTATCGGAQVRGTVAGRGALRARAQHGLGNCAVEVPAESSRQPRRVRGGWRGRQRARYAEAALCALSSRLCIQRPVLRPCTQGQPVAPPGGSGIRHVGGGDARHRALEAYRTCAQAVCLEGQGCGLATGLRGRGLRHLEEVGSGEDGVGHGHVRERGPACGDRLHQAGVSPAQ